MVKRAKTRMFQIWDEEIAECFGLWGGQKIAAYFECLRYRQQLTPREYFTFRVKDIEKLTGLSLWKQKTAREVLEGAGWLVTRMAGGQAEFLITPLAREATGHLPHRKDMSLLYKNLGFSTGKRQVH